MRKTKIKEFRTVPSSNNNSFRNTCPPAMIRGREEGVKASQSGESYMQDILEGHPLIFRSMK